MSCWRHLESGVVYGVASNVGRAEESFSVSLVKTGETRNLVLFEGLDNYGRLQPLLGTLAVGSQAWFEPITENPMLNDVEICRMTNELVTAGVSDKKLIELHVIFPSKKLGNSLKFNAEKFEKQNAQGYEDGVAYLKGLVQ